MIQFFSAILQIKLKQLMLFDINLFETFAADQINVLTNVGPLSTLTGILFLSHILKTKKPFLLEAECDLKSSKSFWISSDYFKQQFHNHLKKIFDSTWLETV